MSDMFDVDKEHLSTTGGCLCSEVSYRVTGPLRPVSGCHCQQCRRTSGHYVAATSAPKAQVEIEGEVRWYQSSDTAKRGFCPDCGSNLFWDGGGDELSIMAGTLDGPTGLELDRHIYVANKGDYYELDDRLPHFEQSDT
ncbi:Glutathione-dependent formaldehyde-activating enzyme [Rhodobacteraceae bacterium THAF1]|uniref:GFA family protein n=1 Tax=Palleronia sp. THAF1 TaxID=2587842 RepID=UPI000F3C5586|nr:GFA family protein [Palleronia sp. THAF1]QFU09462.1 Glutathione-dependent formaldehyde-activating enzyme [Palleronia sp. THAF1]VDC21863.1 Glutathione-dependent formaldehyde-activating enzyme [Rhodobacteraceae bacterium THAF1]